MSPHNLWLGIAILLVAVVHVTIGTWAYGKGKGEQAAGLTAEMALLGSALLAFAGYFLVVWIAAAKESRSERWWMAAGSAVMFGIFSSIAQMTLAMTQYGS